MDELNQSLRALFERVEQIPENNERHSVALRLAAVVNALAGLVGPVPPGSYVLPTCPHCGLAVNVTLS